VSYESEALFIVRSAHERRSCTNSFVTWGRANLMALRDFLEWIVWVERFFLSCPDVCLLNSETSQIHNSSRLRACCVGCMTRRAIVR